MVIEDKITMYWYEDKSAVSSKEKDAVANLGTAEAQTFEDERESNPMLDTRSSG